MNYWHVEVYVEERCADIQREVASLRQVRQATADIGWFEQRIFSLGLWLVAIGERLCQRYETTGTKASLMNI
jgi:hypothetical protein